MRKALIVTAAVVAAVIFFLLVTLPPVPAVATGSVDRELAGRTVPGAFHVHSSRSDGAATKAEISAAAARAGLRFVIFSEHGDGARAADPPQYISGVLCVDAVEISTNGGHYIAIGMSPPPYRLGGEAAAVVEDVRRLGGFGVVAHPDSRKPSLEWTDWSLDVDGMEWLSADTEWRDESRARLAEAFLQYPFRPSAVMVSIFDRPVRTLARWDSRAAQRPMVALAGHDAHGGIGRGSENGGWGIRGIPSYEAAFRSFAIRALTPDGFTGEAAADAKLVLNAIRAGHIFTAIDAIATPAFLDFHARQGSVTAFMGDRLAAGGPTSYSVRSTIPAGGRVVLLRSGVEVASDDKPQLTFESDQPGAYRVEVHAPSAPGSPAVPWLLSNPIYAYSEEAANVAEPAPVDVQSLAASSWRVEKTPGSDADVSSVEEGLRLKYRLEGGAPTNQFAAAVTALPRPLPEFDTISFDAISDRPARISVQLRFDTGAGERWGRSVYVSPESRRLSVQVNGLVALGPSSRDRPDARQASSLLFVVDLTNAVPGSAGEILVQHISLAKQR